MSWKLAPSLETLRHQVNALAPNRSKASDGTIGDTKHSARASDHNSDKAGIVRAIDFTNDPDGGCDAQKLADALVAAKDPRIKYIISRGKIVSGSGQKQPAWKWRPYSGSNKHDKHVHISVKAGAAGATGEQWQLGSFGMTKPGTQPISAPAKPAPAETPIKDMAMSLGDSGSLVEELQRNLNTLGMSVAVTGRFDEATETAVMAFQSLNKDEDGNPLKVDGKVGHRTSKAIERALLKPKIEEAKKTVPPAADKAVKEKSNFWTWVMGLFGAGSGGLSAAFSSDWQTVLAVGGVVIVALIVILLMRHRILSAFDDINARAAK